MRFRINWGELRRFERNLKLIYGKSKVNRWIRKSLGGSTPAPLKRALRGVTPSRTGKLRRSISHQVLKRLDGSQDPVLFVGGLKRRGGFKYYFLRGTQQRHTQRGHRRGRIADRNIEGRAARIGGRGAFERFRKAFERQFRAGVGRLRAAVKRGRA